MSNTQKENLDRINNSQNVFRDFSNDNEIKNNKNAIGLINSLIKDGDKLKVHISNLPNNSNLNEELLNFIKIYELLSIQNINQIIEMSNSKDFLNIKKTADINISKNIKGIKYLVSSTFIVLSGMLIYNFNKNKEVIYGGVIYCFGKLYDFFEDDIKEFIRQNTTKKQRLYLLSASVLGILVHKNKEKIKSYYLNSQRWIKNQLLNISNIISFV